MAEITIRRDGDQYHVWIQLTAGDPYEQHEAFIVGAGLTRDDAVAAAVQELEAAIETLQLPAVAR